MIASSSDRTLITIRRRHATYPTEWRGDSFRIPSVARSVFGGHDPRAAVVLAVINSDEPALQTAATWARDHGFSAVVDRLEMWRYDGEPSKKLADELFSAEGLASTTVARSTPTTVPSVSTAPTTSTTTFAPEPLAPVQDEPLDGRMTMAPHRGGRWSRRDLGDVDTAIARVRIGAGDLRADRPVPTAVRPVQR